MSEWHVMFSKSKIGEFGIVGHVGVGHVHSHSGFVQDDSAGFTVVSKIIQMALPVDLTIKSAEIDIESGTITITTADGGIGTMSPRRGITPWEAELITTRAIGLDAAYAQAAALKVFGRVYGQGVSETAVSFEGCCAMAVIDTLLKQAPDRFHVMQERPLGLLDEVITTVLKINGINVACMLVINVTAGGIGPVEDYEGNTPWLDKGRVMKVVGLDSIPTVIVESKAYVPPKSGELNENILFIRAQKGLDNIELADCLLKKAKDLGIPACFNSDAMPLKEGVMLKNVQTFADRVITIAEKLKNQDVAISKVDSIAQLAQIISEDAGGITFMSNSIHDKVRGAGIIPGNAVVVSMVITPSEFKYFKIPVLEHGDLDKYINIILHGMQLYMQRL